MDEPKPEPDDKEQSQRFIDTARELQVNEDEEQFTQTVKQIIHPKVDKSAQQ